MGKIYLCGHTGSENRGCEALVRATTALLREAGLDDICVLTADKSYDEKLHLDEVAELIPYPQRSFPVRVLSVLRRKLLGDGVWGARQIYRPLFEKMQKGDIIFNIGGDTYCYGTPNLSYAMNELAQERGIPTVFWCCSVDERVLTDAKMQADINRYTYIVAREKISYGYLQQVVKDRQKLFLACDPAFWLKPREVPLPENFKPGQTLGLNLSPLIMGKQEDDRGPLYQNVYELIDQILEKTELRVCLIPHVYDSRRNTQDIGILRKIYSRYAGSDRVCLIEQDLSCCELKYVITQCRFFVGARTHPTIGAYSSAVPALALSYSVKSLGIAQDLFGAYEGYAISGKQLLEQDTLWEAVRVQLLENEEDMLTRYASVLPEYRRSVKCVLKEMTQKLRDLA